VTDPIELEPKDETDGKGPTGGPNSPSDPTGDGKGPTAIS
jgi:hypothetical protein